MSYHHTYPLPTAQAAPISEGNKPGDLSFVKLFFIVLAIAIAILFIFRN